MRRRSRALWDVVWQRAVDEAGIGEDLEAWSDHRHGIAWVWVRRQVALGPREYSSAATREEGCYIGLGVSLGLREARLCLWFGNENDEDRAAGFLSQDDWDPELDETYGYWSRQGLARIEAGGVGAGTPQWRLPPGRWLR